MLPSPWAVPDTTGHITNTTSIALGRHQLKVGGEYRVAFLDIYYDQGARGTLNFDGSRGPWSALSAQDRALADFLAGFPTNAGGGATIVRPARAPRLPAAPCQRDYRQPSYDLFFHDNWQVNPHLNLNFGVRYTYLSPLTDADKLITTLDPSAAGGFRGPGVDGSSLWRPDRNNWAPRFGFAWQPFKDGKTVIRGSYGISLTCRQSASSRPTLVAVTVAPWASTPIRPANCRSKASMPRQARSCKPASILGPTPRRHVWRLWRRS